MAKKDDRDSRFNPKHRIVGVIIIVSLAVIFVPMILKNDPDGLRTDKQRLSHIVDKDTKVYVAQVKQATVVVQAKKDDNKKDSVKPAAKSSPKDSKKPAKQTTVASTKDSSPTTSKAAAKKSDKQKSAIVKKGWLIQVGTFANKSNARRVSRLLKQAGFRVNMTNIEVDRKKSTKSAVRIRVGPFAQKEIAKKKLVVVNRTVGVEGIVIAQP
jgi:DedD protein